MLQKKCDTLQAKCDEYMEKKKDSSKMDSANADFLVAVSRRVKLCSQASNVTGSDLAHFDSMDDDSIRAEAIKAVHPAFDSAGKSSVYLEARFDSIVEQVGTATRMRKGSLNKMMEKYDAADPEEAKARAHQAGKDAWKQPLATVKK